MKKILGLILAVGLMLGALPARAEYPDKAITCIVPFAPGGAADITVRMVADYLSKEIGQPLVIVNKGGGSGIPGLNFGLKARPDGYTVLGGSIGNAFVATYFLGAPAYDMDKIAFVGEDELAKTTLFKILMGELEPDEGSYKWGTTITTSYFPLDNSSFFNDHNENLVEWLSQYSTDNTETFLRSFLGRMLFSGDDVYKPVKVLSGGEKVRCMLSRMMLSCGAGDAAEGDSLCAAMVAAAHCIGDDDGNFTEMYSMDFGRNAIIFCHAGEGNWSTHRTDVPPQIIDRYLGEGGLANPPTPRFTPRVGRATLTSLAPVCGDRFRLLVCNGDMLPDNQMKNNEMPYFFWRPDCGPAKCVENWIRNGGTHHEVINLGDISRRWRMLADMLNIECIQL